MAGGRGDDQKDQIPGHAKLHIANVCYINSTINSLFRILLSVSIPLSANVYTYICCMVDRASVVIYEYVYIIYEVRLIGAFLDKIIESSINVIAFSI